MEYPVNLSYKGNCWPARQIKCAKLSTGYVVFLFERQLKPCQQDYTNPYIVAVKSPIDTTCEWWTFNKLQRACSYYLDMIACYA